MKKQNKTDSEPAMTMQFLQDGLELQSAPGEEHHQIVVHLAGAEDMPVTICELPMSSTCEDMMPDGDGGTKVARKCVITPETMVYLGRIMGNSLDMYEALRDLIALSYGGPREGLDAHDMAATMRARIEKAMPVFKTPKK